MYAIKIIIILIKSSDVTLNNVIINMPGIKNVEYIAKVMHFAIIQ